MKRIAVLLLIFVSFAVNAYAQESENWYVPGNISLTNDDVKLGDILRSHANSELPEAVAGRFLLRAPKPGQLRILSGTYLKSQLKAVGMDNVDVPEKIILKRQSAEIDPALGRESVIDFIRKNAPWPADRYQIEVIREHNPITVNPGKIEVRVLARVENGLAGLRTYQVEYWQSDKKVAQGVFSINVHVQATVWVAAHRIQRGVVLAQTDLVEKNIDIAKIRGEAAVDPNQIVGAHATRTINEGEVILQSSLAPVPVVRRGDAVTMVAQCEGLTVTAFGIAKEDGAVGETIKVVNAQSNKVILARVVSQNTVQVLFN